MRSASASFPYPIVFGPFMDFETDHGKARLRIDDISGVTWYDGPAKDGRIVRSCQVLLVTGTTVKVNHSYLQVQAALDAHYGAFDRPASESDLDRIAEFVETVRAPVNAAPSHRR